MIREALLILALTPHVASQHMQTASDSASVPVFALVGSDDGKYVAIDPIFQLRKNQVLAVPEQCEPSASLAEFKNRFLNTGAQYKVIFGGVEAGIAKVKAAEPNFPDSKVEIDSKVQIRGLTMPLAVGIDQTTVPGGHRRDLTPEEKIYTEQIAKKILASKGAAPAETLRLRLSQSAVVELDTALPEIVASAEVELPEDSGMEYSLFFTVKPDNSDPSIIWYQRPQSEMDAEALYLVDLLDVDGDGSNELIARRVFYENYRYEVYKRLHSRWEQIFKTEVLGCL